MSVAACFTPGAVGVTSRQAISIIEQLAHDRFAHDVGAFRVEATATSDDSVVETIGTVIVRNTTISSSDLCAYFASITGGITEAHRTTRTESCTSS